MIACFVEVVRAGTQSLIAASFLCCAQRSPNVVAQNVTLIQLGNAGDILKSHMWLGSFVLGVAF